MTADGTGSNGPPDLLVRAAVHGLVLDPDTARLDETGWDFRVLRARDEHGQAWILRSPRRPDDTAVVAEAARLASLAGRLPVAVPAQQVLEPTLVAYPELAGAPAAVENARLQFDWDPRLAGNRSAYVRDVAGFLVELHATSPSTVAGLRSAGTRGSVVTAARARVDAECREAEEHLDLPAAWRAHWRRWVDDDARWPDRFALVHGDVHPGHTLVRSGPDGYLRLSGVLDWTDSGIDDTAIDFVYLQHAGGPGLAEQVLLEYERQGGWVWPGLRADVEARAGFLWAHVALLGVRRDWPRFVATALRTLHARPPEVAT